MTNYSELNNSVRVDFFKPTGKWYTTEAVLWTGSYTGDIRAAFAESLRNHFKPNLNRLSEMDAICLQPYHEHAYPIQIKAGGWRHYK